MGEKTFVENMKKILKTSCSLYIKISKQLHVFNRNITRAVLDWLHMILAELSTKCVESRAFTTFSQTCPHGRRYRSHPPAVRQSLGSAKADGLHGRTPWGWPAAGRTSCWGRGAHLSQEKLIVVWLVVSLRHLF